MNDKKLNIIVFVPTIGRGGAEQSMLRLSGKFLEKGHSVLLIVAKRVRGEGHVPKGLIIRSLNTKRTIFSILKFKKIVIKIQPDIVLSTLPTTNFINVLVSKIKKVSYSPYVREANTSFLMWRGSIKKNIFGIMGRYSFKNAHGIIFISKELSKSINHSVSEITNNNIIIYNPIVTRDFFKKADEKITLPKEYKEKEMWVVGSNLQKHKGVDLLIDAVKELWNDREFVLFVLGTGERMDYLKKKSAGLPIVYLGYVNNPLPWYKAADFFLPSYREGLGNSLIEAQLLGTTAIASDCQSGPKEIIQLFNNGINFGVGDLSDLIEKIQSVDIVKKKKVEIDKFNYFDEDKVADEYLKFFTGLSK